MDPTKQNQNSTPSSSPSSTGDDSARQRDATADLIRNQISRLFGDPTGEVDQPKPSSQPVATNQQPQPQPATQAQSQAISTPQDPPRQAGAIDYKPPVASSANQSATATTPSSTPIEPSGGLAISTPVSTDNPYHRTQQNTGVISSDQWQKYHSSWQEYYQKYYERYYLQTLAHERQKQSAAASQPQQAGALSSSSEPDTTAIGSHEESISKAQAISELRSQIKERVSSSTAKVRKSRHFMPIIAGVCVLLLFLFLQYNRVLFAAVEAYVSPGSANPEDIIVNPASTEAVTKEPQLIIPKLNISVPVVYENTMGTTNQQTHNRQMKAMERGVAWFGIPGANSKPGQNGNTVLSGHSSNDVIDPGEYKFIFARLDKLREGDTIYANYKGTRYTYRVTGTKVVKPNDVESLRVGDDKPTLTLITCTPLGTALNRLLVYADQISPDPATASAAEAPGDDDEANEMPGNSPTMLQRIFNRRS